jgi:uncharacterized protein YndB with AHSA1/START domain
LPLKLFGEVTMNGDRIQRSVFLRARRARVWQALSDPTEFGEWFGIEFNGAFKPGARLEGKVTHPGYEHLRAEVRVQRVEPGRIISWQWHPHAIDPNKNYSLEPVTLVVLELVDVAGGTRLIVTETGFDKLPKERREEAYRGNEAGWSQQMDSITRHLATAA